MRKARHTADDLRAGYKLSDFKTKGVRGKHVKRYRLVEFFRKSPLVGVELELTRDRDAGRKIEL